MKVLLDIKDAKAPFVMELLRNLSFVKVKPISAVKADLIDDIKEAVEQMNMVKTGKLKARNARELLKEL